LEKSTIFRIQDAIRNAPKFIVSLQSRISCPKNIIKSNFISTTVVRGDLKESLFTQKSGSKSGYP